MLLEWKIPHTSEEAVASSPLGPLGAWYGNLLRIQQRKCVLFTNEKTLFSFLVHDLKRRDFALVPQIFREHLARALLDAGISGIGLRRLIENYRDVAVAKTESRKVLGCMNDLAWHCEVLLQEYGSHNLQTIVNELNDIPQCSMAPTPWPREMLFSALAEPTTNIRRRRSI